MKIHRITTAGNSACVTLAKDELNHLEAAPGFNVTIQKAANNRLIIKLDYSQDLGFKHDKSS